MAQRAQAWADNAAGPFFVDRSCIDCETCYHLAPDVFEDAGGHSRVHRQPRTDAERRAAQQALVACPTASIGTDDKAGTAAAARDFPRLVILLMTGFADQRERASNLNAIAHDVVTKPFFLADIRAAVADALAARKAHPVSGP